MMEGYGFSLDCMASLGHSGCHSECRRQSCGSDLKTVTIMSTRSSYRSHCCEIGILGLRGLGLRARRPSNGLGSLRVSGL